MSKLLILFPSQLFDIKYIKLINPDYIVIYEHSYFFTLYPYHKLKLVFHIATINNYFDLLNYKKKIFHHDELELLYSFIKKHNINEIHFFNPIEKKLIENIKIEFKKYNIIFNNSPYFLNSDNTNINITIPRHDLFYKSQRIKYNIMVTKKNDKWIPDGDKWSFDTENRKPFEKSHNEINNIKFNRKNNYLTNAVEYVNKHFKNHYGIINLDNFIYPINRKESIKWLKYFIKYKLDNFGKYEDAISSTIKFGYHSLLSPLTNIGLITPHDIIKYVNKYNKNITSKEGFIRQLIGWREYCYYTYDLYGNYLQNNFLYKNKHKIPNKIWNSNTQIPFIDNILNNVNLYAYSHHIERLMCIGNFFILVGIDPHEMYKWFQTMYIDAYDVFMIPNVYGMLCYGKLTEKYYMMTRPYFASSNYILKMSDYKSSKCIKINNEIYDWTTILDALYWNHISNYTNEFKKIYSVASAVKKWNTFSNEKKIHIKSHSKIYIDWFHSI